MTALPLYNKIYSPSNPFIQSLLEQTVPTSTSTSQSRSPLAPAACLILGNLIDSDDTALQLAPQIPLQALFSNLNTSNDTAFLNAASGLLRHLATPLKNREDLFDNESYLRAAQRLYTDVSLEQVQVGGLALTRQIVSNMKPRLITTLSSPNIKFLPTLLTSYQNTTSTPFKLEVSKLCVSFLRTLQPSSTSQPPNDQEMEALKQLFDAPVNIPGILDPLVFAITHESERAIEAIQAEAWLGLNFAVRLPFGAEKVGQVFEDEKLFGLYCSHLAGGGSAEIDGDGETKDERPQWLKEKQRDNAVLLGVEIIKAEGVDQGVKEKFRSVLKEKDVVV